MPRKPIIYTSEFPYHITARCNNRAWFAVPIEVCWDIFAEKLNHIIDVYNFQVHSFVLMSNHYHMLGSTHIDHPLGEVMNWLQPSIAKKINSMTGNENHVFGGPYRPSLITTPYYFAHATRYVFQNPIYAGICKSVEEYPYSTCVPNHKIKISPVSNGIDHLLQAMSLEERFNWYNQTVELKDRIALKFAFSRSTFRIARPQGAKKPHWMSESLVRKVSL